MKSRLKRVTGVVVASLFVASGAALANATSASVPLENPALPEESLKLKFGAGTAAGFFVNSGSAGGSAPIAGGIRLRALLGIGDSFAVGLVSGTELDYQQFNVLFGSIGLHARRYLIGSGFPLRESHPWIQTESIDRFGLYAGAEVLNNTFFIGSNSSETTQTLTGTFLTLGFNGGVEYRLSRNFELAVDLSYGLASFASSDDRIRLNGYALGLGVNYLW